MDGPSGKRIGAHTFIWRIENFLWNAYERNECLMSPVFKVEAHGSHSHTEWRLHVYPSKCHPFIKCYLKRVDKEGPKEVSVGFDISCITADGKFRSGFTQDYYEFKKESLGRGCYDKWKWSEMLEKREFFFPGDNFTVLCRLWMCSLQQHTSFKYTAVTHIEVNKLISQKIVPNFSALYSGHAIKCHPSLDSKLKISLYVKEQSEYLTVEFQHKESGMRRVRLHCKLSVLDSKGISFVKKEEDFLFPKEENCVWNFPNFIRIKELVEKRDHTDDVLNLKFEFIMNTDNMYSRISETKCMPQIPIVQDREVEVSDSLTRELGAIYLEERFADVKLRTKSRMFSAHKAILGARSPVFAAMFSNDMIEKKSGIVQVDDVDAETLHKLLLFVYTGELKDPDENMAMRLLSAADKYQILPLKVKCAIYLKSIISSQNACQILQLADMHQEESLKKAVQEFICHHHHDIFSSDEWRYLTRQHGELASDIIQLLSVMYSNF